MQRAGSATPACPHGIRRPDRRKTGWPVPPPAPRCHARPAGPFSRATLRIGVQPDHQPVADAARLLQRMHMARIQQVEAAVGEADAAAQPAPAVHLFRRRLARDDFAQRTALWRQGRQHVLLTDYRGADLADHHLPAMFARRAATCKSSLAARPAASAPTIVSPAPEMSQTSATSAACAGRPTIHQRHALFAAGHQHGAEAVPVTQRRGGGDHRSFGVRGHPGRGGQLPPVWRHHIGTGVAAVIRVLADRPPPCAPPAGPRR